MALPALVALAATPLRGGTCAVAEVTMTGATATPAAIASTARMIERFMILLHWLVGCTPNAALAPKVAKIFAATA